MRIAPSLLSAACLLAAAPAAAQAGAPPEPLAGAMHAYLSRAAQAGFGGSVLVARGGQVVLHHAYGWADPDRAVPVDTAMPFYVASLSKGFTAAGHPAAGDGGAAVDRGVHRPLAAGGA